MKNYLLVVAVILLPAISIFGQGVKPAFTREKFDPGRDPKIDLQQAVETAGKEGKHIILDVGGEWCGWCIYMDRFFFQNPELAKIRDDNFVWVKVNYGPDNENPAFLTAYPAPTGYPHLFVLDARGNLAHSQDTSLLEKVEGYDLEKFTAFLKKWSPSTSH